MRNAQATFKWVGHPALLVVFVAVSLAVSALGVTLRSTMVGDHLVATQPPQVKRSLAPLGKPDCSAKPCLALTFDDGPSDQVTPQVLDILAREQVKATFFVVGVHVAGREGLVQREYREGYEVGNHTWSHADLSSLPPEAVEDQIQKTQRIVAAAGVPAPRLLRPPYGAIDPTVASHTNLTVVRWNIDPEDWKVQDPGKIYEHIVTHARPGAIILMHDIYPSTAAALEPTIQTLKGQYQFVTASELLDLSPGDQGQYFGR